MSPLDSQSRLAQTIAVDLYDTISTSSTFVVGKLIPQAAAVQSRNLEVRSPKEIRRPKAEIRPRRKESLRVWCRCFQATSSTPKASRLLGFRVSVFCRISAFGLRISRNRFYRLETSRNRASPTRSSGQGFSSHHLLLCAALIFVPLSQAFSAVDPATDWPAWRGPTRDGIAAPGQNPPLHWSETEGVLWKAAVPGRGHGSPTVVGNRVYLATAEVENQSVLCLNRNTGQRVWETKVHGGQPDPGHHSNSSAASSTAACDGSRLYINFLNAGAVYTSALDLDGKLLWQHKVCDFVTHQGFGSSPVLYESLVIVSADHRAGGVIAALNRDTGEQVWSQPRPKIPNYTSPAVVNAGGRTQVVLAGCNLISSFDPASGKKLWELDGSSEECVVTPVTDGTRIFTSGGYPKNHTVAVFADGSNRVAWQNTARVYVPSMIQKEGYLYAVMDASLAVCWTADTGTEMWKERLGGDFFASPVMVGNRIYATNVRAKTYVFEATPKHFEILAQNQLGDEAYASPVICGSRIYLRAATHGDRRQEYLYCIGNASTDKGLP